METMQPALKNGRNVWDSVSMPKDEFERRMERVRSAMSARGLDLLLVYTTGLTDYGDAAYLTNFIIRLPRGTLVAIPKSGEVVTFFEGASRGIPSLKLTLAIGDLKAPGDLTKDCAKYLKEKNLIPGTVGFAGLRQHMPYQQFRNLTAELTGCTFIDTDDLLVPLRIVKSLRELDQIRRTSRILSQLIVLLKGSAFERASERVVEAAIYMAARFEGAEDFRVLIARPGQAKGAFRPVDNKPLIEGEKILFYLAVEFERYWAEAIRTFVFRNNSFTEEGDDQATCFSGLCKMIKPGVGISEFCQGASSLLGDKGMEVLRPYGLGNGIGLGLNEAPLLAEQNSGELREGMVLSLRAAFPQNDGTYSMVGNTVLVEGNGAIVLTEEPRRPEE